MALVLLNARMSERSFKHWSAPAVLPLIALMLSKFSLIMPLSTAEAIRFQLLQAPPFIVNISADLKYCVGEITTSTNALKGVEQFLAQLNHREVWMASSVHKGEHEGELRELYRLMPISVIGGSFLPTSSGHNIAEAMAAGSAVITGPHVGHFSHMVSAMQSFNPLSILQVSGEAELIKSLHELLSDPLKLEARQTAAKQAFHALSFGILSRVWIQLDWFILKRLPV
uniref:3-deoxy-D-manno-octulosonic-acid transferase N-terminal domain-containing protein n=1 Tax=Chenopodium quinoa TaxID=63459 RepID=A0A803MZQ4_CHEQI